MPSEKNFWTKTIEWFGGVFKGKDNSFHCHRCKQPVLKDQAFILVKGEIVCYNPNLRAQVYSCPEQAFNYAQRLILHSTCWIEMLKEYGVDLYDMSKVAEEYQKEALKKTKLTPRR